MHITRKRDRAFDLRRSTSGLLRAPAHGCACRPRGAGLVPPNVPRTPGAGLACLRGCLLGCLAVSALAHSCYLYRHLGPAQLQFTRPSLVHYMASPSASAPAPLSIPPLPPAPGDCSAASDTSAASAAASGSGAGGGGGGSTDALAGLAAAGEGGSGASRASWMPGVTPAMPLRVGASPDCWANNILT